ncbi:circadian associated repressor of transcription a [Phycodurus eques]|uniref:circadian associated repressor of transcription a n=1 Tax=Phycodurus eques TaxID=693459 RepID=UPI002ACE0D2A|nr:circadian associated repressor of transcription a [Phycodurus eques]
MNQLGTSSQWASYDLHPTTPNYILSESELTEDEADILSEGEEELGTCKALSGFEECFRGRLDKMYSRSKRAHHTVHVSGRTRYHLSPGAPARESSPSAGDIAFTQKCTDLRKFICPLMELLHGLKTGRFDKGLTGFQQSVAMDRLQRILGILQRPEMGERYLHNLLQIEGMLKLWFPQVAPQPAVTLAQTFTPRLITHWRQNQLSMPVKKRKFTWSDSDYSGIDPPKKTIRLHESCPSVMPCTFSTGISGTTRKQGAPENGRTASTEVNWTNRFALTNNTLSRLSRVHVKEETQEHEI